MICPDCGAEIPDGHMYCDVCGKEFHMVPEFEPEIENQIDKTLSRLAQKIGEGDAERAEKKEAGTDRPRKKTQPKKKVKTKRSPAAITIGVICGLCALAIILFAVLHKSTDDYLRIARTAVEMGNGEEALTALTQVLEKRPQDAEAILLSADAYALTGQTDEASEMLMRIINSAAYDDEVMRSAYEKAFRLCLDTASYQDLSALIDRCPYTDLKASYAGYVPGEVTIHLGEGTYEVPVEVEITTTGDEIIYYTLNGSAPDTSSLLYDRSVVIEEEGTYLLQAVSFNTMGVAGEVKSVRIEAEKRAVPAPQVLEDSGTYTTETRIVVVAEEGLRILYETGEDAEVTEHSEEYTEPLSMPPGESFYHFACIDEDGNLSETVTRQYRLDVEYAITVEQAVQNVAAELVRIGILENTAGVRKDGTGVLSFAVEGTVSIGNDGEFYFIREYLNASGAAEPTGLLYAVNTQTGLTRRLGYDTRGQMMLMQFN